MGHFKLGAQLKNLVHGGTANARGATGPYEPLRPGQEEFRLLTLKAGGQDDPIECQLHRVPFARASKLAYETVSYCWGDAACTSTIGVNGCEVSIPSSALQVLRRFRNANDDQVLWIDAVCINQADIRERSAQVTHMGVIYKSARQNRIWLGDDDGTAREALDTIYALLKEIRQQTGDFATFYETLHPLRNGFRDTFAQSTTGIACQFDPEPLFRLFSRPWFSRVWIVQEAALSPLNVCSVGNFDIPLMDILRVATWLAFKQSHLPKKLLIPGAPNVMQEIGNASILHDLADSEYGCFHVWGTGKSNAVLLFLLTSLYSFKASDPRDYVYGLLALYQRFGRVRKLPALLQPNYSKSLAEVFQDAAKCCIIETQTLEVLRYVRHRSDTDNQSEVTLPSWVPRWDLWYDGVQDPKRLPLGFKAAGSHWLQLFESSLEGPGVLQVKGLLVDGLRGGSLEVLSVACHEVHGFGSLLDTIIDLVHTQKTEQSMTDIIASLTAVLLCCHKDPGALITEDDIRDFEALLSFRKATGRLPTSGDRASEVEQNRRALRFSTLCFSSVVHRRIFVTTTGRIGLGPPTMRRGDFVALLYGGQCPYILRRQSEMYEFVGESYVHGIMFGEAIQKCRTEGSQKVTFSIR